MPFTYVPGTGIQTYSNNSITFTKTVGSTPITLWTSAGGWNSLTTPYQVNYGGSGTGLGAGVNVWGAGQTLGVTYTTNWQFGSTSLGSVEADAYDMTTGVPVASASQSAMPMATSQIAGLSPSS